MAKVQPIDSISPAAKDNTQPKRPAHWREQHGSGFEGREALLGQAMSMVIKTLNQTQPYQHQVNGALVLAHLGAIQFAKNHGLLEAYVEHDRKMMEPVNFRIKKLIAETGNKELALEAVFDITECHYQLVLDTKVEPGKRSWVSPFKTSPILKRVGLCRRFPIKAAWQG